MDQFRWDTYVTPDDLTPPVINDPTLPMVSIVTPSYNQGHFIRETIESVLGQDYPNIEYWVIDGGSTDNTTAILREYESDPRFHWISEPDKGQSDAINKGWSRCQGNILAWLCSDDLYCPGAIQKQVDFLLLHPEIDAVYSDATYIDVQGHPTRTYWARNFSQYELLRICFIPQVTIFLRQPLVERTGPVNTALHHALDYDYWLRASLQGTFDYSPGIIAQYRLHDDSKTVAQALSFNPEIEDIITNFFTQTNVPPELLQHRKSLLADLMLEISINLARADHLHESARYYFRSLKYRLIRPRVVWLILNWIQTQTHLPLADWLSEHWLRLRSKL